MKATNRCYGKFSTLVGHDTIVLRSRTARMTAIIALLVGASLLVFALGAAPDTWRDVRRFLRDAELEDAVNYLRGFGGWTVVIVLTLFVVESLLAPLPTWFLMIANGMLFGPWLGGLISFAGVILGALAAFSVARWLGRRFIRRFVPAPLLSRVDDFSRANGFAVLLVLRLVPFTSSDIWSYVAGMSRLPVLHFLAATAIGDLPGIALFSFVGQGVLENPRYWRWLAIGGGVILVGFIGYRLYEHFTNREK